MTPTELMAPPPEFPTFSRWLWKNNPWAYGCPIVSSFGLFFSVWSTSWNVRATGVVVNSLIITASLVLTWRASYPQYLRARRWDQEDREWVDHLVETGIPRGLAWAMCNLISQGKTHVAAFMALEYLKTQGIGGDSDRGGDPDVPPRGPAEHDVLALDWDRGGGSAGGDAAPRGNRDGRP